MEFAGKVVWITGGGGRIGPVIGAAFAREGAAVGFSDLRPARAEDAAEAIRAGGGRALAIAGDVSDEADVDRVLGGITSALGAVDILVNCHGVAPYLPILEMDIETWQRPFRVNVQGCFLTCRATARQLVARRAKGCIVNVSSHNATSGRPRRSRGGPSRAHPRSAGRPAGEEHDRRFREASIAVIDLSDQRGTRGTENMVKLVVANPVAESAIQKIDAAPRPSDLSGTRVGLYWNLKPGGNIGLDRIESLLRERYPSATFLRFQGSVGASVRHLTPKDADKVAAECQVVVGTTGD